MVWIVSQVAAGGIAALSGILASVVWHAGLALSGVALVAAGRNPSAA